VNVSVGHSWGTGVTFSNAIGTVKVENSFFNRNRIPDSEASISSGGSGVYIEFTHIEQMTNYSFKACSFLNNNASTLDTKAVPSFSFAPSDFKGMGRGGGMCIYLKAQTTMITITITDSVFQRNSAVWGGGLYVGLLDNPNNNTIYISNTKFDSNYCSKTGGGIKINYLFDEGANNFVISSKTLYVHCKKHHSTWCMSTLMVSLAYKLVCNTMTDPQSRVWFIHIARPG